MKVIIDDVEYMPKPLTPEGKGFDEALNVLLIDDYENLITVRQYLCNLLVRLWEEKESFSGKRPFGNSDWDAVITYALAREGFINLGKRGGSPKEWKEDPCFAEYYSTTKKQEQLAEFYVNNLILYMCAEDKK